MVDEASLEIVECRATVGFAENLRQADDLANLTIAPTVDGLLAIAHHHTHVAGKTVVE